MTKQVVPRALQQSAFDSALVPTAAANSDGTSSSTSSTAIPHPVDAEFTEEEIESAFKFLDLDRNNYIGAAEIRCCTVPFASCTCSHACVLLISVHACAGSVQMSVCHFLLQL
jgi:hypothetical protein